MKKISIILFFFLFLIFGLTGCGSIDNSLDYDSTSISEQPLEITEENILDDTTISTEATETDYYDFLKVVNGRPAINLGISEYLENYNRIKSPFDKYSYSDLQLSDFNYIEIGNNHGIDVKMYATDFTILGRNSLITIIIGLENDNTVNQVCLRVQNIDMLHSLDSDLLIQYSLLIEALGIPHEEVINMITEMFRENGYFDVYRKGLSFFVDEANGTFFRILPMTKYEFDHRFD